jgi:hypothetical protein
LDHDGYLPVFAHITEGSVHEVTIAQGLSFPRGSIVVCDLSLYGLCPLCPLDERRGLFRDAGERQCRL